MLTKHFNKGTENTQTGGAFGAEVETDFTIDGLPISTEITQRILAVTIGRPRVCEQKLELGRQKIELSIAPQPTPGLMLEATAESLDWLNSLASRFGAKPVHSPEIRWHGDLLYVQEERDAIWVNLDGQPALEELCRCSSVQFTVNVNPNDAIAMINKLWQAEIQLRDYGPNNKRWLAYMAKSLAKYQSGRYGGPSGFTNLADYANQLEQYYVVMHNGRPTKAKITDLKNVNIDLFLRSVWWHFRLRRYGNNLALEMRPFARRKDSDIATTWQLVAQTLGL